MDSAAAAVDALCRGALHRRKASTALNAQSSRSHAVFTAHILRPDPALPNNGPAAKAASAPPELRNRVARLTFVDLAGSERQHRTHAAGLQTKEAQRINTSLLTLGQCLTAMRHNQREMQKALPGNVAADKLTIVPFRNSKMTSTLRDVFQGMDSVVLSVNVSPQAEDYDESAHVLKYAALADQIRLVVQPAVPAQIPQTRRERAAAKNAAAAAANPQPLPGRKQPVKGKKRAIAEGGEAVGAAAAEEQDADAAVAPPPDAAAQRRIAALEATHVETVRKLEARLLEAETRAALEEEQIRREVAEEAAEMIRQHEATWRVRMERAVAEARRLPANETRIAALEEALAKAQASFVARLADQEADLEDAELQCAELQGEVAALRAQLAGAQDQAAALQAQVAELKSHVAVVDGAFVDAQGVVEQLRVENGRLRAEAAEAADHVALLTVRLENLEEQRALAGASGRDHPEDYPLNGPLPEVPGPYGTTPRRPPSARREAPSGSAAAVPRSGETFFAACVRHAPPESPTLRPLRDADNGEPSDTDNAEPSDTEDDSEVEVEPGQAPGPAPAAGRRRPARDNTKGNAPRPIRLTRASLASGLVAEYQPQPEVVASLGLDLMNRAQRIRRGRKRKAGGELAAVPVATVDEDPRWDAENGARAGEGALDAAQVPQAQPSPSSAVRRPLGDMALNSPIVAAAVAAAKRPRAPPQGAKKRKLGPPPSPAILQELLQDLGRGRARLRPRGDAYAA